MSDSHASHETHPGGQERGGQKKGDKKKVIGAFDIRVVIGGLVGVYGIILTLLGLFHASDEELARGDGFNVNLWGGIGMLIVGALFVLWARLRPLVVAEKDLPDEMN